MEKDNTAGSQVMICNIVWNGKSAELPKQLMFDIPEGVLEQANKNKNSFNDIIETFCYNALWRKFKCEVNFCQVWFPFEGTTYISGFEDDNQE